MTFVYFVNEIIETVPKKMRLVFWVLADLIMIFHEFGIRYAKSISISAKLIRRKLIFDGLCKTVK